MTWDPDANSAAALNAAVSRYHEWASQPQNDWADTEEAVHADIEADGDEAQIAVEYMVDEFAELRSLFVEAHKTGDETEIGRKFVAMVRRRIKERVQHYYDAGELP
ncbi:hypothetical protein [Panacagrimonas sp.]|uniref:hypothetical protein n=1 Tax=Panacagrimonas sp. TaxID=2480088 RepID=UPI003B519D4F